MVDARMQVVAQKDLKPMKEAITKHVMELTKLHTILFVVFDRAQIDMRMMIPNALECEIIFKRLLFNKVRSIAIDYKVLHAHITQELQVEASPLAL